MSLFRSSGSICCSDAIERAALVTAEAVSVAAASAPYEEPSKSGERARRGQAVFCGCDGCGLGDASCYVWLTGMPFGYCSEAALGDYDECSQMC